VEEISAQKMLENGPARKTKELPQEAVGEIVVCKTARYKREQNRGGETQNPTLSSLQGLKA